MVRRSSSSMAALCWLLAGGCVTLLPDQADPCATWREPGLYRVKIDAPDKTRKPWVYVPASEGPRDVVVMLHGAAQSGRAAEEVTRYLEGADAEGFVAVFPDGLGWPVRTWNAGECCLGAAEDKGDNADVAFLERLVRELVPRVCGDDVLATGFSNGAMMAHRWACEGEEVDAVAPVAGPLMSDPGRCVGDPVPVRHYHGTNDTIVPPEGGQGSGASGTVFTSVDRTMEVWRARNACSDKGPIETRTGDTVCSAWSCEASTEVCLVEGWDHRWPGGRWTDGTDANATSEIWRWFQEQFPDDEDVPTTPKTSESP